MRVHTAHQGSEKKRGLRDPVNLSVNKRRREVTLYDEARCTSLAFSFSLTIARALVRH